MKNSKKKKQIKAYNNTFQIVYKINKFSENIGVEIYMISVTNTLDSQNFTIFF